MKVTQNPKVNGILDLEFDIQSLDSEQDKRNQEEILDYVPFCGVLDHFQNLGGI